MAMVTMARHEAFIHSRLDEQAAIRARAQADGYLYLPGLLPKEALEALRLRMQRHLQADGWCDDSVPPRAAPGLGAPVHDDHDRFMRVYKACYGEALFHGLPHHPQLMKALAWVLGEPLLVHPRHILRVQTPGSQAFSTPPHQDYFYIGGSRDTWTAWIPLTDCPRELGSLAVQPGSHKRGFLPVRPAQGAGGHAVAGDDGDWHCGDFAQGDVLLMHSLCVHQALDNQSRDRIRLSVDLRYQNAHEPVHPFSLEPHIAVCSWEEAYEAWPSDHPLRYYWRNMDLKIREQREGI